MVGDSKDNVAAGESHGADVLRWLVAASGVDATAERRLPALATVACVYAGLCAPRGASQRAQDLVARFTLLFFVNRCA